MSITFIMLTLLFAAVSVAMVLLILVQRPQGGGLAGAFGGAGGGGTDTAFGGRTGDALTVATVGAFTAFIVLGAVINIVGNPGAVADAGDADAALLSPELVNAPVVDGAGAAVEGGIATPDTVPSAPGVPAEFRGTLGDQPDGTAADPAADAAADSPDAPATPPVVPPTDPGAAGGSE